jgi:hypothetical protein
VPINVNDERYLLVLFSVVAELRSVFHSPYIHLGTDEREASAPCFKAARIKPKFDAFEHKLATLMGMAGVDPGYILRSENKEGVRYANRTGNVTQYSAGVFQVRRDEMAFLTVDLFDGDAYQVFQNAQRAASLSPLGVLAELRKLNEGKWKLWQIPQRLLAFAMGVSDYGTSLSTSDAASFNAVFSKLCEDLELDTDCSPPGKFQGPIHIITDGPDFAAKNCELWTTMGTKHVAIAVKPYFEVQASGEVTALQ